jgi:hypothetical protein
MIAVPIVPIAYSHPNSINQNSTPQYRSICRNNVRVRIAVTMKIEPTHTLSFGDGRNFLTPSSVAPQNSIPRLKNVKKLASIQILSPNKYALTIE